MPKITLILFRFLSILILVLYSTDIWCCTCERLYFCEFLRNHDKQIAIEARVLHHKMYSNFDAVYLEVDEVFRDDVGITSIIKLYGESETAGCQVDVIRRFPEGSKVYIIIGLEYNGEPFLNNYGNPDDIYEDYWEVAPFSCLMVLLQVDNNIVSGLISPEFHEYPLQEFESHLQNCDFSMHDLNTDRCAQLPFRVYPNPTNDGVLYIGNEYKYTSIKRIKIYDISGRLLHSEVLQIFPLQKATFSFDFSGLYIIEFQCEENTFFEKVIVQLE